MLIRNDDDARREVAWVAKRARDLLFGALSPTDAEWLEFYTRKAALLRWIGEGDLAQLAEDNADQYRSAML